MHRTILGLALTALVGSTALADKFVELPRIDNKANGLEIRFVRYTGGTNGEMIVDVRNKGPSSQTFIAEGLYFVPNGNPETAPQRLGAAGPFRIEDRAGLSQQESLLIAPRQTRRVYLQVFCVDSHRSSPQADNSFKIARKRLPKQLRTKISTGAKDHLRRNHGDMKKAKSAIQSHIWESRDSAWIELEGERADEKSLKNPAPRQHIQRRFAEPPPQSESK